MFPESTTDSASNTPSGTETLDELFHTHYDPMVRFAVLLLGDRTSAEEVVQDAFVKMHMRQRRLGDPDSMGAYLRQSVLNGARSHLRWRGVRRRRAVPADSTVITTPERSALDSDRRRQVLAALDDLPLRQREVMVMRYWLELSEDEIAAALGISQGAVKTHAHRARQALAATLGDRFDEE
jgi:RNA polymerase sigma-70 factor (sigma-E family)